VERKKKTTANGPAGGARASRTNPSSRPPAPPRRRGHGWLLRLGFIGLLCATILLGYMHHLSGGVKVKFEGKRWSLPAHVFARPLELFPGAPVPQQQLIYEMKQLGYRPTLAVENPGSYGRRNEQSLTVFSRGYAFWDGVDPSLKLDIDFDAKGVTAMRDDKGANVSLLRLEPVQIGSIYPAHREDRVLVRYQEIPKTLVGGLLAAEDRDYFDHHGISIKGISRALMANIKAGRTVQGGSTLTQQLVKNFYLTRERSLKRKANEALMAIVLDYYYSKEDILEAYANEIYLGQDGQRAIHGFGLAARYYFNLPISELPIKDQALLIALIRGPSYYNPIRNPERAKLRRDLVLDLMAESGVISPKVAAVEKNAPLGLKISRNTSGGNKYPAFLDLVQRQLSRDYREQDLNSEGLRIYTTLDPWVQYQSELAVPEQLVDLEKLRREPPNTLQGSVVVVGRENGEVQALVGDRTNEFAGFNRALDSNRPIGSLVKPAIYLSALTIPEIYTLVTPIPDTPYSLVRKGAPTWSPKNYDGKSHGVIPLYKALAKSYNLATVRLGMEVGVTHVADTLRTLGVDRKFPVFPSMLLGTTPLAPIEVVQVYQTIASGGYRTPLRTIREILDQEGKPLSRYPLDVRQVIQPGPMYLLSVAMQKVVTEGTATTLSKWLPKEMGVAGKTGTTDELRDSWFAGFTGDRVTVAWVGRDDNKPTGLSGATGALQLWGNVMKRIAPTPLTLIPPEGVVFARASCSDVDMPFLDGYIPPEGACSSLLTDQVEATVPDGAGAGSGGSSNSNVKSGWSNPWEF
jgi:penicillin-binding protein 1B